MNPQSKWVKISGVVIQVLVAALLIFAGGSKLVMPPDPKHIDEIKELGIEDRLTLIGVGELVCAVLLLIPYTTSLGTLMTSGLWGGVISIMLAHHKELTPGIVLLVLTWVGGFLRGSVPFLNFGIRPVVPQHPPVKSTK